MIVIAFKHLIFIVDTTKESEYLIELLHFNIQIVGTGIEKLNAMIETSTKFEYQMTLGDDVKKCANLKDEMVQIIVKLNKHKSPSVDINFSLYD